MRFWSQAPNFLESEAQAVVPSPQISGRRTREDGVDHLGDGALAAGPSRDEPPPDVEQVLVG